MPRVNADILVWARETAGLSREEAVEKLDINDAHGVPAVDRLAALESTGDVPRPLLLRMAKQYRRPLLTFYMSEPPRRGDRGEDFRTLPEGRPATADALLDALVRDVRARQSMVRSILEDEEEVERRDYVGSLKMSAGVPAAVESLRKVLGVAPAEFFARDSAEDAFDLLRGAAEAAGVFVLLIGNLGSHHTAIDLETFRGLALADPIAPFVVINDGDAKSAWSFSLLHEFVHLLLGATGVSGETAAASIEQFCNEAAGEFLLPSGELAALPVTGRTPFAEALVAIDEFAEERNLSRAMVSYKLLRAGTITHRTWQRLSTTFRDQWLVSRAAGREKAREAEGGPSYYVVRRHRLGRALLDFVRRTMSAGALTPTKAGIVLGVKPRNVEPLLSGAGGPGRAA